MRIKTSTIETLDAFVFCLYWKKYFLVWWGAIIEKTFNSINQWLSRKSWSKLTWYKSFSAIFFTKVDNWAHNYQTWAANKSNLQEFPYRTISFKYSLFPLCVTESNSLENTMRKAKFIKHFKSMLCSFPQYFHDVFNAWPKGHKLLTWLRLKFSHLGNLKFFCKLKNGLRPNVTVVMKFKQLNTFFLLANSLRVKDIVSMTTFVWYILQL